MQPAAALTKQEKSLTYSMVSEMALVIQINVDRTEPDPD